MAERIADPKKFAAWEKHCTDASDADIRKMLAVGTMSVWRREVLTAVAIERRIA